MPRYTRRQIVVGLSAIAYPPSADAAEAWLSRERAIAILESTWATGSQAGNALKLRGELAIFLASMEGEARGRVIIQSFIDRMEGMTIGMREAHSGFGNQSLVCYLRAQLRVLRAELVRRDMLDEQGRVTKGRQ